MPIIQSFLFKPITIIPLVFIRIVFGGIMLWEVWRYFHYNRVVRYFIDPLYYFHYYGFEWVKPLPGDGMNWLFVGMGILAGMIAIGLFYRASMISFWLIFTYMFLLDQTQYLNHFYLVSLISFLMIFVPAHRAWSLDVVMRPSLKSLTVPNWSLWLLRGQMAIVYIYGAIAKINPDWLRGEPMRDWLADRTHFPLIGHLFTEEWMVYLFSYGGLLFDLLIVPLLLWKPTRIPALLIAIGFHLTNHELFNIGIFPWFALGLTLLFLPPDWFRLQFRKSDDSTAKITFPSKRSQQIVLGGLAIFFGIQLLMPLRHFLYPGYVSWTEEGHTLAWHMKLRSKGGYAWFFVSDPASGATRLIDLSDYLNDRQISKMEDNPPMILRFSHYLAALYEAEFENPVEIKVRSMMSLNGRAPQLLIDPTANLAQEPDTLAPADWILPLVQPPAPHTGYPALLISGRISGVLTLTNMTEHAFPIADFLAGVNIEADQDWLERAECMLMVADVQALQSVFPICNEVSRFNSSLNLSAIQQSRVAGFEYHCRNETCVIVANSSG